MSLGLPGGVGLPSKHSQKVFPPQVCLLGDDVIQGSHGPRAWGALSRV